MEEELNHPDSDGDPLIDAVRGLDLSDYLPPVRIEASGRFVKMQNRLSEEENRQFIERLKATEGELKSKVEQIANAIREECRGIDPFAAIGAFSVHNLANDPNSYRESTHPGRVAYAEYLALLYLLDEFPAESADELPLEFVPRLQFAIEHLFRSLIHSWVVAGVEADFSEEAGARATLRFQTLTNSLMVRYAGFSSHLVEFLEELLEPLDSEIHTVLGFRPTSVLTMYSAWESMINARLNEATQGLRKLSIALLKAVKRYRRKKRPDDAVAPEEVLAQLAALPPSQAREQVYRRAAQLSLQTAHLNLRVDPDELAEKAGLSRSEVESVLEHASLDFGKLETRFGLPCPTHPLQKRAFIHHDGEYFCPVPSSLMWTVRPNLEECLNPASGCGSEETSGGIWERYQSHRAVLLEQKAVNLLSEALGAGGQHRNLKYRTGQATQDPWFELDGLIAVDDALFLVECKAKSLTDKARRGAPLGMIKELKEIVEEAQQQTRRALQYIEDEGTAKFVSTDGEEILVDSARYPRKYRVVVSLEPLDVFITDLNLLVSAGVIEGDDFPWIVPLFDLQVICELSEWGSVLASFLDRRLRLHDIGQVQAHDELDWFGHYLVQGLFFDDLLDSKENLRVNLTAYTEQFDAYYMSKEGSRTDDVPKPRLRLPETVRRLLAELEDRRMPGYMEASIQILSLSEDAKQEFANALDEIRRECSEDNHIRSRAMVWKEGEVFLCFGSGIRHNRDELYARVLGHCERFVKEDGALLACGITSMAGSSRMLDQVCVVRSADGSSKAAAMRMS